MSIEHKLNVKQINKPDYQANHKGFLTKAKYLVLVPIFTLALACTNEYRTIRPKENVEIKINKDYSSIILKTKDSRGVTRTDYFRAKDEPAGTLEKLNVGNLELVKYKYNPKGLNKPDISKIDSEHDLDRQTVKRREHEARMKLQSYFYAIRNHVKR